MGIELYFSFNDTDYTELHNKEVCMPKFKVICSMNILKRMDYNQTIIT